MGEVKDAVKGTPAPTSPGGASDKNLSQQVQEIADKVGRLVTIKDEDALTEGDAAKPENLRKAASLRASYTLLRAVLYLLEGY